MSRMHFPLTRRFCWIIISLVILLLPSRGVAEDVFQERSEVGEEAGEVSVAVLRGENPRGVGAVARLAKWLQGNPAATMVLDFGAGSPATQVVHTASHQRVQGVMLNSPNGVSYYSLDSMFFEWPMMTSSDVCLEGICGVLSALFSVTHILGVVDPSSVTNDDGTYKRDALEKARSAAPAPWANCGTTSDGNSSIHIALGGKGIRCDPDDTSFDPQNATQSCRTLANKVAAGEDCTAQIVTASELTHFMPITQALPFTDGVCAIDTRDTTNQGDGKGNGVPADLAVMDWSIRPRGFGGTGVSAFVAAGPKAYLWNGPGGLARGTTEFRYRCCRRAASATEPAL